MIYNAGKIIAGLIVFVVLLTFPFWYSGGKAAETLEVELSPKAKKAGHCVEPKEYMRREHMQLLNDWRDAAVREGNRTYVNAKGESYTISLQNTCVDCHSNKDKFCDKCHDFMGVSALYCWDCHLEPKEKELWASTDGNF